jgi:hypothetical protein
MYVDYAVVITLVWTLLLLAFEQGGASPGASAITVLLLIGGLLAFPVFYFWWFFPRYLAQRTENARQKYFATCYEKRWRVRLFRYVQSCGESPSNSLTRLNEAAAFHGDSEWMNLVLSFCHSDLGLLIFARAQMFVG